VKRERKRQYAAHAQFAKGLHFSAFSFYLPLSHPSSIKLKQ
jgi:hypothetical protein